MQLKRSAAALAALLVLPVVAQAGFIGQADVTAQYFFPNLATPYAAVTPATPTAFTVVAGPNPAATIGVEPTLQAPDGVTRISFSFMDSTVSILFNTVLGNPTWNTTDFNGVVLTFPSGHGFSGATVTSTTMGGFDDSRLAVTSTEFRFNWNGLSYVDGTRIDVRAVPEPVGLAFVAFAAAAAALRRRA
jgi:hypothetical protein